MHKMLQDYIIFAYFDMGIEMSGSILVYMWILIVYQLPYHDFGFIIKEKTVKLMFNMSIIIYKSHLKYRYWLYLENTTNETLLC